jgi:type I restriction enzyme S subunit
MASNWRSATLGQIAEFLSGSTPSKDVAHYWGGSIPWASAKDMKRLLLNDTEDHLTEEGAANGIKIVPAGTVLLLTRGMTLLNDVPICIAQRPMTYNQDVKALRPRSGVREDFLPYLLLGHKERLLNLVDLAGHGTGRLNSDELKALDVMLPTEHEQTDIARILGALDKKVEINRQMNETLEALAHALFQSWFVAFDPVRAQAEGRNVRLPQPLADGFPNSLVDSELGDVPKGWSVGSILDLAQLLSGGTPKTDRAEYWNGDIAWASAKDVSQAGQLFLVTTERSITQLGVDESATQILPAFCTVIVARGATTGRMVLLGSAMAMNQTCYALRSATGTPFALYCQLRKGIDKLVHAAHGSVFDTITTNTFASSRIVLPPLSVLRAFEEIVAPLFHRVLANINESRILATLRDTLLPRLLSGQLRVSDVAHLRQDDIR